MILYPDIETVPEYETFDQLPDLGQRAFEKKFKYRVESGEFPDISTAYEKEASFHAEFAKIVCIAVGMEILDKEKGDYFFVRGLGGTEEEILKAFVEICKKVNPSLFCAHNGKKFDYPFIRKRCIILGIEVPRLLETGTLKPWEVPLLDTVELWRGLDLHGYASLITLCYVFGIASSKEGIDGSEVKAAYFAGKIEEIRQYCMRDVCALYFIHKKISREIAIEKVVLK